MSYMFKNCGKLNNIPDLSSFDYKRNIPSIFDNLNKHKYKYEILSPNFTQFDTSFKIIIIGDSDSGKSRLLYSNKRNIFEENYNATIGFEFQTFNIRIKDKIIKLQIWETCGQEFYRSLISNFYRNSSLAIIVYAINNINNFNNMNLWIEECRIHSRPDVKCFLIGNRIGINEYE